MAAMARTLGIPARVAVGFTPGSPQADGSMSVGLRDAHAWPEVYFEGVGWTRFEPTPTRGTTPDYTRPETPSDAPSATSAPDETDSVSPDPEPTDSATDGCAAEMKRIDACPSTAVTGSGPTDSGTEWTTFLLTGAVTLLLLLLVLLPMLWRLRVRALRLRGGGRVRGAAGILKTAGVLGMGSDQQVVASGAVAPAADGEEGDPVVSAGGPVLAAWREFTDTAWDYGIVPDDAETPRKAAARIVRVGRLDPSTTESAQRLAAAVEQVLYAARPRPETGLSEDVQRVRVALRNGASRRTRIRAVLAPRSAVRVLWALSERWAALTGRLNAATARWSDAVRRRGPSGQEG
jgi:hypothetical protein